MASAPTSREIVRTAITACSRDEKGEARPVHSLRLSRFCARYDIAPEVCEQTLSDLSLCKELQKLAGGYWLPAPLRVVPFEEAGLVLSPQPTSHLNQSISVSESFGIGRLTHNTSLGLPVEDFSSWLDAPLTTVDWTRSFISNAEKAASQHVGVLQGRVWAIGKNKEKNKWSWQGSAIPSDIPLDGQWHLARIEVPRLYFLVRRASESRCESVSCAVDDASRLRFGLPSVCGVQLTGNISRARGTLNLFSNSFVPRAEWRLLTAISSKDSEGSNQRLFDPKLATVISGVLSNLGVALESI